MPIDAAEPLAAHGVRRAVHADEFECRDPETLYRATVKLPWEESSRSMSTSPSSRTPTTRRSITRCSPTSSLRCHSRPHHEAGASAARLRAAADEHRHQPLWKDDRAWLYLNTSGNKLADPDIAESRTSADAGDAGCGSDDGDRLHRRGVPCDADVRQRHARHRGGAIAHNPWRLACCVPTMASCTCRASTTRRGKAVRRETIRAGEKKWNPPYHRHRHRPGCGRGCKEERSHRRSRPPHRVRGLRLCRDPSAAGAIHGCDEPGIRQADGRDITARGRFMSGLATFSSKSARA